MTLDMDMLAAAIKNVAEAVILPRFISLNDADIEEKSKGDFVTIADREAEQVLSKVLQDMAPDAVIVGEEATAANPALLECVTNDSAMWFVDPIDGTAQFIAGDTNFATMIAYAEKGEVRHAAIYFPVSGELFLAEKGAGAILQDADGSHRLTVNDKKMDLSAARATFHTRHYPSSWNKRLELLRNSVSDCRNSLPSACQYTGLARGTLDLVVYHRMLPWDHAPGSLILNEAGGLARDLETGKDYRPATLHGPHVLATSEELWNQVRRLVS